MIGRILLIDIDLFRDGNGLKSAYYTHHPIGLLYLVSSTKELFPEIKFRVFHTSTSNDPLKSLESILSEFSPDLIGLRSLSIAKEPFKLIAKKIRKLLPDVFVAAGGPYPSSSYADLLQDGLVDIVAIGEGEKTFVELIESLCKHTTIPTDLTGTALMVNGTVKTNELRPLIQNIDAIPFPDYNFIELKDYSGIKNHALQDTSKSAFIFSTRGCPYSCFYCHHLFGEKIRRRSPENIVAEMREHIEKRGIYDFVFLDDLFNVPMKDCKAVLTKIAEELLNVRICFPNGLRADQIDDEMLDLFEKAGTFQMGLAVEVAVPRLQKLIGKNLDLQKAKKAIQAASRRFIVRTFFMIGFPGETYEDAMETLKFAKSLEYVAQPMLSVLRVYKNTPLFHMLDPTEEQARALAEQEEGFVYTRMLQEVNFYGDMFSREKVPLKSDDINKLFSYWMRNVLINRNRIRKSHVVLEKHLDKDNIFEFYRGVFDSPNFNADSLKRLLAS
jgi:radical SAM superfamily enzyme YgiQ (UPF0313 family)